MTESSNQSQQSTKFIPAKPFQPGNKLARGGKREGAGRKSKKWEDEQRRIKEDDEFKVQTARELYRAEQQRQARKVIDTYYRLATSGRYPQATLHEIDKIDPDEQVTAPTLVINFVAFNTGSPSSSGNTALSPIDVTPTQDSALSTQHSPVYASPASPDAPRLTFTDIKEKD